MTTNEPLPDAELTRLDIIAIAAESAQGFGVPWVSDSGWAIFHDYLTATAPATVRRLVAEVRQLRRIEALAWDWLDANSRPDWAWTDDRRLGTLRAALRERRP